MTDPGARPAYARQLWHKNAFRPARSILTPATLTHVPGSPFAAGGILTKVVADPAGASCSSRQQSPNAIAVFARDANTGVLFCGRRLAVLRGTFYPKAMWRSWPSGPNAGAIERCHN